MRLHPYLVPLLHREPVDRSETIGEKLYSFGQVEKVIKQFLMTHRYSYRLIN